MLSTTKSCAHCGNPFQWQPQRGRQRVYCSDACSREAQAARRRARQVRATRSREPRPPRVRHRRALDRCQLPECCNLLGRWQHRFCCARHRGRARRLGVARVPIERPAPRPPRVACPLCGGRVRKDGRTLYCARRLDGCDWTLSPREARAFLATAA